MSLAAVWGNYENPEHPTVWMAADSRLSDATGLLIDAGMKLFEVPITCRGQGRSGFYDRVVSSRSIGMVAVGGSLVFQHVYGTMVAMLGSLVGEAGPGPTNADVAGFTARLTTAYVRKLGIFRPKSADRVEIAIGGVSAEGEIEAFAVSRNESDRRIEFLPEAIDLSPGQVTFMGDQVEQAARACKKVEQRNEPGAPKERAALNVIRAFVDDPDKKTIGGEIQVGCTIDPSFRRMFSVRPVEIGAPEARMSLNTIELADLALVGSYEVAPLGMVIP
jgi:hypothetical protein